MGTVHRACIKGVHDRTRVGRHCFRDNQVSVSVLVEPVNAIAYDTDSPKPAVFVESNTIYKVVIFNGRENFLRCQRSVIADTKTGDAMPKSLTNVKPVPYRIYSNFICVR